MMMNNEYVCEGYNLMSAYLKENKLKTKHRNFVRRLDRFYNKNKDKDILDVKDELKYLELEKYFFENIAPPKTTEEMASLEFLKIMSTKVD